MGNSASSLPFSVDKQVGAPHDHNGWALHEGKSTDSSDSGREVSVFVGKKPAMSKTPVDRRQPNKMQLEPALRHYDYCRKLRHPHILKVYATLDTDNPSAASISGAPGGPAGQQSQAQQSASSATTTTGDLIVVTEPCIPLSQWLMGTGASGPPTPEQLAWGLECVVEGLAFLHNSAKLAHGCISPQSLYVTPAGDVKLWNFSLVTPVGPNTATSAGGPDMHFLEWEAVCCPESYRSPERVEQRWDAVSNMGGVHAMDSYSLGVLIADYWFRNASNMNNVPQALRKALQRLQTPNIKMRPRLQPLLKCPVFDTEYKKLMRSLDEIPIQPIEQKINLWQNLGMQMQQQTGVVPIAVAKYKILPMIITTIQTTCSNPNMLAQDMYRREVLAMLGPLFFIEENYQDREKVGKELAPLVAMLFTVPDRGVRSILLNTVGFLTKTLDKNALNSSVFGPLCSGFNDSSPVLREMTLKATQELVSFLNAPNIEKLSRYLVRLQADAETSLRTSAVVFIAKIAPHLSDVPREKMLLPAYARSLKDPFPACRVSALRSLTQSKPLFSKQDLANKVMPCLMPLLLDPMTEVRKEAFKVVRDFLKEIQQESNLMTERGDPPTLGAPNPSTNLPKTAAAPAAPAPVAAPPASGNSTSSGYLSGISSWMTSPSATPAPAPAPKPQPPAAPRPAPPQQPVRTVPQPPTQQFAATSLATPKPAAPIVDDGWGDDDDDGWSDNDDLDDNALAFSNIGASTAKPSAPPPKATTPSSFGGMDDDPFASIGMKTVSSAKPRAAKGKLVMPSKKKPPPAKKLTMSANEMSDGWDDF